MLSEWFLNTKIALYEYYATGEGVSTGLVYEAYNCDKEYYLTKIDPFFWPVVEYWSIQEIIEDRDLLGLVESLSPLLYNILTRKDAQPFNLVLNIHVHFNYS